MFTRKDKKPGPGRPTIPREDSVGAGIVLQPRFPRAVHKRIREAAAAEGLPMTTWVRRVVLLALAEREKNLPGR